MGTRAKLGHIAVAALCATGAIARISAADRIAYQGRLVMGSRGIVVMSGAGENPVELPYPAGSDRITPALSPDGSMLAFAAKAGDTYKLWVVRLADDNSPIGEPKQLTTGDSSDEQPAFSPDGKRIAYVSGTGDNHALVTIPVKGGSPTQVTALGPDFRNACPHWSPDGSRIVYSGGGQLFIIGADGGDARQLADDGMYPSWSPDGTQIAFFKLKPQPALSVISPGGGEPITVARNIEFFGETVWSPDGRYIAFKADKVNGVQGSLWLAPAAGGPARPLRSYGVAHGYLDWSGPVTVAAGTTSQAVAAKPAAGQKPALLVKTPGRAQPAASKPAPARKPAAQAARPVPAAKPATPARPPAPAPAVAPPPPAPVQAAAPSNAPAKPPEAPAQPSPVGIISPAEGAVVRGITKITVSKDAPGGYVAFFVDGAFGKATVAPYEMDWDTQPGGDGPHTIAVTGYGAGGGVEGATEIRVEARNAISPKTLPQEGVTLRYRFKPEEKWDYQIKVVAQAGAKGEVPAPILAAQGGSLEAVVAQRVEEVKETIWREGSAPSGPGAARPLAGTPGKAAVPVARRGAGTKAPAGSPPKPETVATIISRVRTGRLDAPGAGGTLPLIGQAARSLRSLKGLVTTVSAPDERPIALGNLSIGFPEQPVKSGDKWTAPMTILPLLRSDAVARVMAEHKVDGLQWEQGVETIRIISTFKVAYLPLRAVGMTMQNVTGRRTTWFAYKEHQVVRIEDRITGTFDQKKALQARQAATTQLGARAGAYAQPAPGRTLPRGGTRIAQPGARKAFKLSFGGSRRRTRGAYPSRGAGATDRRPRAAPQVSRARRLGMGGRRIGRVGRQGVRRSAMGRRQTGRRRGQQVRRPALGRLRQTARPRVQRVPTTAARRPQASAAAAYKQRGLPSPVLHYTLSLVAVLQK